MRPAVKVGQDAQEPLATKNGTDQFILGWVVAFEIPDGGLPFALLRFLVLVDRRQPEGPAFALAPDSVEYLFGGGVRDRKVRGFCRSQKEQRIAPGEVDEV